MPIGLHLTFITHHLPIGLAALVVAVTLPFILAAASRKRTWCITARLAWIPVGAALVGAIGVAAAGPSAVGLVDKEGFLVGGLWANTYSMTLIVLVALVGALIQNFSLRYLHSDTRAFKFAARANLVVGAMTVVVSSATLLGLVIGWVIAGMAFVSVLKYRPELPGMKQAAATTRRAFLAGDAGLVVATGWVIVRTRDLGIGPAHGLQAAAAHLGAAGPVVAVLVAIAALARSAQFPLGRWMVGTVNAPTPASALLHAGVVNGGGILLLRMSPLVYSSTLAIILVFASATVTLIYSTLAMRARVDVKGSLALSTRAQMAFMLAEVAVGLPVAAMVHLIGHALYKATLFLGSGNGIVRPGTLTIRPVHSHRRILALGPVLAGLGAAAMTLGVMLVIPGVVSGAHSWPLLVFALATTAAIGRAWWSKRPSGWGWPVVATAGLAVVVASYATVLSGLEGWMGATVTVSVPTALGPWWLAVLGGLAVMAVVLAGRRGSSTTLSLLLIPTGVPGGAAHRSFWLRSARSRVVDGGTTFELEGSAT
ncbi:MAG: proton-conducting transporter transmembrane domain-containing protein [Ferrimicrobium sp.]